MSLGCTFGALYLRGPSKSNAKAKTPRLERRGGRGIKGGRAQSAVRTLRDALFWLCAFPRVRLCPGPQSPSSSPSPLPSPPSASPPLPVVPPIAPGAPLLASTPSRHALLSPPPSSAVPLLLFSPLLLRTLGFHRTLCTGSPPRSSGFGRMESAVSR